MLRWLGVVCLVILLTSCTTQVSRVEKKIESLESLEKVEIGYKKHLAYLPLFIGLEKGFFTEEKLEVQIVPFDSTNQMVTAVATGKIDAAIGGANLEAILSLEEKSPGSLKVFTTQRVTRDSRISCVLVKSDSTMDNIKDLKGKNIATLPGTFAPLWIKATLKTIGIGMDEVQVQGIDPKLQLSSLETGKVDALFAVEPICSFGVNKKMAKIIYEEPVKNLLTTFAGSALSSELFQKDPKTARKIIKATDKSIEYMRENPSETIEILAKHTGYERSLLKGIKIPSYATSSEITREELEEVAETLYAEGIIKEKNVAGLIYS